MAKITWCLEFFFIMVLIICELELKYYLAHVFPHIYEQLSFQDEGLV